MKKDSQTIFQGEFDLFTFCFYGFLYSFDFWIFSFFIRKTNLLRRAGQEQYYVANMVVRIRNICNFSLLEQNLLLSPIS